MGGPTSPSDPFTALKAGSEEDGTHTDSTKGGERERVVLIVSHTIWLPILLPKTDRGQ